MQKIEDFLGKQAVFREYNPQTDPPLIVKHLYTTLNNIKGLKTLAEEDREYFLGSKDNFRLVVDIDNELIASLVVMREKNDSNVFTMYSVVTAESYRNSGISKKLFDFACSWVFEYKGDTIVVWTDINNIPAQKFYLKCGFTKESEDNNLIYYKIRLK